jgi:hypothetical protein
MSPPTCEERRPLPCRASVGWRLAAALYTKAGGTPKNVATGGLLDADMAYGGMPIRRPGGLEFVTYGVSGEVDPRNPLIRAPTRTVLSRSLNP